MRLHQDIRILCRIVRELEGIDLTRVYVNGASQGGGLGIATCALNSELINRAAILYPFLSDFRLVWDLDADDIAYEVCAIGRVGLTRTRLVSRKPMPNWRTSIPRTLPPWSNAPFCLARHSRYRLSAGDAVCGLQQPDL
ncbi:MAG: acetylxylan esterase [Collinsella sp.]